MRILSTSFAVTLVTLAAGALPLKAHATEAEKSTYGAKILDSSDRKTVLFTYKHEAVPKDEGTLVTNTFTSPDGKVAAVETAEFVKDASGPRLRLYKMDQKQVGAVGQVEVKDGVAHFSYSKDGATKTSSEKVGDDFIAGPSLVGHLQARWAKLMKGDTVKTRFVVLDRRETVGFQFYKEKETEVNGQKAVVIKMKPSSFLIAALVDPLHFYFTPDGQRLLQMQGRVQVKKNEGGKWKDLDALTVYEY